MIVGTAIRPRRGEKVSGDAIVVRQAGTRTLFAVIDALGHGPVAHETAQLAVQHLEEKDIQLPAAELMKSVHEALRGSRGAAVTLGVIDGRSIEVVGVGNVELRCRHGYVPFASTPGIVGMGMRRLRVASAELQPASRLFIFSDGISRRVDLQVADALSANEAATTLLSRYGNLNDDASILCLAPAALETT